MPPRGRPTLVVLPPVASSLCRVALVCLVLRRRRRLPIPCSRGFSRLSAQLCPPGGIFWPLEFIELSSRKDDSSDAHCDHLPPSHIVAQVHSLFEHLYLHRLRLRFLSLSRRPSAPPTWRNHSPCIALGQPLCRHRSMPPSSDQLAVLDAAHEALPVELVEVRPGRTLAIHSQPAAGRRADSPLRARLLRLSFAVEGPDCARGQGTGRGGV